MQQCSETSRRTVPHRIARDVKRRRWSARFLASRTVFQGLASACSPRGQPHRLMPLSVVKRGSQQCSRKEIRASPVYALEQDLARIRVSFIPRLLTFSLSFATVYRVSAYFFLSLIPPSYSFVRAKQLLISLCGLASFGFAFLAASNGNLKTDCQYRITTLGAILNEILCISFIVTQIRTKKIYIHLCVFSLARRTMEISKFTDDRDSA